MNKMTQQSIDRLRRASLSRLVSPKRQKFLDNNRVCPVMFLAQEMWKDHQTRDNYLFSSPFIERAAVRTVANVVGLTLNQIWFSAHIYDDSKNKSVGRDRFIEYLEKNA